MASGKIGLCQLRSAEVYSSLEMLGVKELAFSRSKKTSLLLYRTTVPFY